MKFEKQIKYKGITLIVSGDYYHDAGTYDTPPFESLEVESIKTEHGDEIYDLLTEDEIDRIGDAVYESPIEDYSPEFDD